MSRGTNYSPSPLFLRPGLDYGATYNPYSSDSNYTQPVYSRSHYSQSTLDTRGPALGSRRSFEEWRFQRSPGMTSFPTSSHTPFVIVLEHGPVRQSPFRPREIIPSESPPRAMEFQYWNMPVPELEYNSQRNRIDQRKVLENLKKVIYNPPRRRFRTNVYYRDIAVSEKELVKDEDTKRCAICLEDFAIKEEVMVTPCQHMFHEECIVPWVKSKAQCPVCRSHLSEQTNERDEILSIMRAMGGAAFIL